MAKQTNKEKAIAALINAPSIREAARQCGLSEETLYRYLKDKEFVSEYRQARRATVENAITQIQQATSEAVETLKKNLHCENPAAEIRAAQIILENSIKGVETIDVLERLERLEDEYQKQIEENGKSNKAKW
jgi:AcrR family transcriptional regulator